VSRLALDEAAGLTEGHASKLLASSQIKGLNRTSLGCLLGALGLVLIVATDDDPAVRARIARMPRRKGAGQDNPANSRTGAPHGRQTQQHRCVAGAWLKLPVISPTYFAQQLTRPYPAWALSQGAPVLCGFGAPITFANYRFALMQRELTQRELTNAVGFTVVVFLIAALLLAFWP
jgi:hypothetical protein